MRFSPAHYQYLLTVPGVAEMTIETEENLLYVKIDKEKIAEPVLRKRIEDSNLANM